MINEFVTIEELSHRTGVPEEKIRELVAAKRLGHHIVDGEVRIPYEWTIQYRVLDPYKIAPKPEPEIPAPATPPESREEGVRVAVKAPEPQQESKAEKPKGGKKA